MSKTKPTDNAFTIGPDELGYPISDGLTKREYFAIEILSGICAGGADHDVPHGKNKIKEAVEQADALIEELNKDYD